MTHNEGRNISAQQDGREAFSIGQSIDSTAWTGPTDDLTDEELTKPLRYRHTEAGDRRTSMIVMTALVFSAVGAIYTTLVLMAIVKSAWDGHGLPAAMEIKDVLVAFLGPPVFGLVIAVLLKNARILIAAAHGEPVLLIDEHGIEDKRTGLNPVPWAAIDGIRPYGRGFKSGVLVDLKQTPGHTVLNCKGRPVRLLGIWTTPLEVDARRLARLLSARRRSAIGPGD